jgi:UDP-N-acetyl-D-mannosaminuronic acid dehydrogenase
MGADLNKEIINAVSVGKSHIKEPKLANLVTLAVKNGNLKVTHDSQQASKEADIIIISVQTPITKDLKPNQTYLITACEAAAKELSKGKLVIIRSTVSPGTTENLVARVLEKGSGLKCGEDFWLAHCPERMAPGRAIKEFEENITVVGGYNSESSEVAVELFKTVTKGEVKITDCMSSEVTKLVENTFRDVNIALANEIALICEKIGTDVMEIIELANTHPRVEIHKPGCGVGGPCLPKDPHLLLYPVNQKGFKSKVIAPSRELNNLMPEHVVKLLTSAIAKTGKNIGSSKVALLGVAYKGGVGDVRNSPAEKIIRMLLDLGTHVTIFDPFCKQSFGAEKASHILEAVKGADCLVIATEHKLFMTLRLEKIKDLMNESPIIFDGRRIIRPDEITKFGFNYYGIGFSA